MNVKSEQSVFIFKSFAFKIFIVALVLRLIPVLLTRGLGIGLDDMFQYDMLARSLVAGNGYRWYAQEDLSLLAEFVDFDLSSAKDYDPATGLRTSFRAPLYPAFLALVYYFSGTEFSRFFAARLAQAVLLGAPLAPLTYLVSRRLFASPVPGTASGMRSERAARLSAWIVAGYPMLLVYPLGLGTENPFFLMLLASAYFLLAAIEKRKSFHFVAVGLFLALTALTRSVILPFAAVALIWLWFSTDQKRGPVLAALTFGLAIAPWVVRNSLLHQKPTGIETSLGYNLYLGYHPQGNGSFVFGPSLDLLTILDDAERDRVGTEKAREFIASAPERFGLLAVNRLAFFFGLEKRVLIYFYSNNLLGYIPLPLLLALAAFLLLPFVVLALSAALALTALRPQREHVLLILLLVSYSLPHVFILSEDRFHLALVPYLAILAAQFWTGGVESLADRWRRSGSGKLITVLAVLAVFLLLANWGWELWRDADKIARLIGPDGHQAGFPY